MSPILAVAASSVQDTERLVAFTIIQLIAILASARDVPVELRKRLIVNVESHETR